MFSYTLSIFWHAISVLLYFCAHTLAFALLESLLHSCWYYKPSISQLFTPALTLSCSLLSSSYSIAEEVGGRQHFVEGRIERQHFVEGGLGRPRFMARIENSTCVLVCIPLATLVFQGVFNSQVTLCSLRCVQNWAVLLESGVLSCRQSWARASCCLIWGRCSHVGHLCLGCHCCKNWRVNMLAFLLFCLHPIWLLYHYISLTSYASLIP